MYLAYFDQITLNTVYTIYLKQIILNIVNIADFDQITSNLRCSIASCSEVADELKIQSFLLKLNSKGIS